jgi:hypothetical protein
MYLRSLAEPLIKKKLFFLLAVGALVLAFTNPGSADPR